MRMLMITGRGANQEELYVLLYSCTSSAWQSAFFAKEVDSNQREPRRQTV